MQNPKIIVENQKKSPKIIVEIQKSQVPKGIKTILAVIS